MGVNAGHLISKCPAFTHIDFGEVHPRTVVSIMGAYSIVCVKWPSMQEIN